MHELIFNNVYVESRIGPGSIQASRCHISLSDDKKCWTISEWFTKEGYQHQGWGKSAMSGALQECCRKYGMPKAVQYTWNGVNPYVMEWLEKNFDAECTCPIAVQKKQPDDDKASHIYSLDTAKVSRYFGLHMMQESGTP